MTGVSVELKEIIRLMMEPDPNKRPPIIQILEHQYVVQVGFVLQAVVYLF